MSWPPLSSRANATEHRAGGIGLISRKKTADVTPWEAAWERRDGIWNEYAVIVSDCVLHKRPR